jgi:ketosteroid isomerase-like protein
LVAGATLLAAPADEIQRLLDVQTAAWNRGDIPGFMKTYDASEATAYVGASGVTKGYNKVLARYQQRYPTREKMGQLRFSDLEVRMLNGTTATATGRFHLTRSKEAGGDATGWFTLILLHTKDGWKIVHDHTS